MNRTRKHKIKQEVGASCSNMKDEEHDLAYYIHDRVELMHQVFSVIKPKELKAMAPSCVQHISIDNLQELCTEELLGISSKRLLAILDGAEPPTDTESSSSEQLETISLDSISSDDDVLSEPTSKKKQHKHRKTKHRTKSKHRHKQSSESEEDKGNTDKSKANRAGLTVLELLELQARARAIRAQLQKDNASKENVDADRNNSSDEVEIKEEPPEVLEISSDEEKPRIEELDKLPEKQPTIEKNAEKRTQTVTKVVNDLIITIPVKPTKKIKLNRNISVRMNSAKSANGANSINSVSEVKESNTKAAEEKEARQDKKEAKEKAKKKRTKKINKDGSDHDEITLQLSDTEKMDLLEDLDRKNFDDFTSSDDDSSSDDGAGVRSSNVEVVQVSNSTEVKETLTTDKAPDKEVENVESNETRTEECVKISDKEDADIAKASEAPDGSVINDIPEENKQVTLTESHVDGKNRTTVKDIEITSNSDKINEQIEEGEISSNKDLSDGEIAEREANKDKDVVCISDDDIKTLKKKKKKDKKSKKEKKKSDFHESSDQNFYKDNKVDNKEDDDDIYEVLELSDTDYEVDLTVSQEPTADEIKALSAKIDEKTNEQTDTENISWRDRYLDSKKVKKILTTANLLNALRKKNKELKNKLESKPQKEEDGYDANIEGTVEQFNTLEGSTKYVDPVKEKDVTKEMKKDAKQLLKMYKMLLKYNDINKQRDPNRKKKKKKKSKEKKDGVDV